MDYSDLIAGVLGGFLGSIITAFVSLHILRKQFVREEKTIRESRSSQIMENVEASIWTILSGHLYEFALNEKVSDEFNGLPTGDKRGDLVNNVSVEKMRTISRIQDAERKLVQQKSLIELFVGSSGVSAFDKVYGMIPDMKEALSNIDIKKRKVRDIRPDEASNWYDYSQAVSELREILWEYADYKSFDVSFFYFRIKPKVKRQ